MCVDISCVYFLLLIAKGEAKKICVLEETGYLEKISFSVIDAIQLKVPFLLVQYSNILEIAFIIPGSNYWKRYFLFSYSF